ncbi:uncharacterized protein LOC128235307 [Mya arenaria]|uniref:uncharacterized protein LOC128235307 n=1 Tax=Mya arenaria TaxID=6604 RepID=UPI0022E91829|nr:uncharacterized protein LOC128235307 [Mya arenaria]
MDGNEQEILSLRVSRVLEHIGVTKSMIKRRRSTWLVQEKLDTVRTAMIGYTCISYYLGSQSEGTTTLKMRSDRDMVIVNEDSPAILDRRDWIPGKSCLLIVKHPRSPPQHCNLQRIRSDVPQGSTEIQKPTDFIDSSGRILVSNAEKDDEIRLRSLPGDCYTRQGPSRSLTKDVDIVEAYRCAKLPSECRFIFQRPRPGHWPTPALLEQARNLGIFIVPQGYPYSDCPNSEWRFSTSLTERRLMFSLTIVQIKVYVLLKMIRISFFKPLFGDRLSTFHFKTALLFTIESYPPGVWHERNILNCVCYCLQTLYRWTKIGYVPHFTISNVNLLVGKIHTHELKKLLEALEMVMSDYEYLKAIVMDDFGKLYIEYRKPSDQRYLLCESKRDRIIQITFECIVEHLYAVRSVLTFFITMLCTHPDVETALIDLCPRMTVLQWYMKQGDYERQAGSTLYELLCGTYATIHSAHPGMSEEAIPSNHIRSSYVESEGSDLLSGRLKYAAMLYTTGQYEEAANKLKKCEELTQLNFVYVCDCKKGNVLVTNTFNEDILPTYDFELLKSFIALDVIFCRFEIGCTPGILVFEMYRTSAEDLSQRHPQHDQWMDMAVIQPRMFLYYLQFLTYMQLNRPKEKYRAAKNLFDGVTSLHNILYQQGMYAHVETGLNLLGHCYELENLADKAWECYATSFNTVPRNNAAKWHMMRLLHSQIRP